MSDPNRQQPDEAPEMEKNKGADEEKGCNETNVGEPDETTGQPILYIVYSTHDFIVSIDKKLSLNWLTIDSYTNYASDFGEVVGSVELSDALVNRIFHVFDNRFAYKKMLGSVIGRILDDGNSVSARKLLAIIDERINDHGKESVRTAYITWATITVILVGISLLLIIFFHKSLAGYGLDEFKYQILMCSLLGGVGSFISTFARFKNYQGSLVAGLAIHRLDGFLRIFYGLIAGLLIILAIKANVIIGFTNDSKSNPWLFYFLAMIAGASEILIPNLIGETEGELGIKKLEKKEEEKKTEKPDAENKIVQEEVKRNMETKEIHK